MTRTGEASCFSDYGLGLCQACPLQGQQERGAPSLQLLTGGCTPDLWCPSLCPSASLHQLHHVPRQIPTLLQSPHLPLIAFGLPSLPERMGTSDVYPDPSRRLFTLLINKFICLCPHFLHQGHRELWLLLSSQGLTPASSCPGLWGIFSGTLSISDCFSF